MYIRKQYLKAHLLGTYYALITVLGKKKNKKPKTALSAVTLAQQ